MGKTKSGIAKNVYIDKSAVVAKGVTIGDGTKIWSFAQIGENVRIGKNCVIGNGAYIDRNVVLGNNVKIHNKALLYHGLVVEDNCFIGPGVCFTNDKYPAYNKTRDLSGIYWKVKKGASIGALSVVLPDVIIGRNAVVGAGSVVTKSVPDGALVYGNPARIVKKS